jgi:hypothetical protein
MPRTSGRLLTFDLLFLTALAVISVVGVAATADDASSFVGSYTREFTGAGGQVTETLEVKADKSVVWTSTYPGRASMVQSGIWNSRGKTLIVVLGKRDGEQMPANERVVFDLRGDELKGREYDKNVHGDDGLVFHRK